VFDLTLDGIQQMNRKSFMTGGVRSQTLRQSRRVQRKAPQQLARSRQQLSCVAETKTAPAYFATYNEKKNVAAGLEDAEKAPMNTYSPKKSYEAEIVSVERIVGPNATGETCHIVIKTDNNIPFWEGQSYGIVPPGTKVMPNGKEKAHAPRLYSIASSRYGDTYDGNTTSLCSGAPPTGAPRRTPRMTPRRESAPTSCATPSLVTRSR
jgi:ferredoxin--NADP+ reductase